MPPSASVPPGSPQPSRSRVNRDAGWPLSPLRRNLLLGMAGTGLLGACSLGSDDDAPFELDGPVNVSAQRLDQEVVRAFPLFNAGAVLPDFEASLLGARNDVALYRLTTTTTVPETGEAVAVTGLLALPVGASGPLPVVSWQHGTILSFDQTPSNLTRLSDPGYTLSDEDDSLETLFNVHRFAANGFAVIAADYIGKGPLRQGRGEGYSVKGVTTATCLDILHAGLEALRRLRVTPGRLFLHGWSQGSLNSQWLHQALRSRGTPITATAVASPFSDLQLAWLFWTGNVTFPLPEGTTSYPAVPDWVSLCMIVAFGSYETYYGIDGLIESAVRPEFRQMARQYWNDYQYDHTFEPSPTAGNLLVPDFFEAGTDVRNRRFLQHVVDNSAANWRYDSPIRFHVGLADEATHPGMTARVLETAGPLARGITVAGASHRATFLAGLYGGPASLAGSENILSWFRAQA